MRVGVHAGGRVHRQSVKQATLLLLLIASMSCRKSCCEVAVSVETPASQSTTESVQINRYIDTNSRNKHKKSRNYKYKYKFVHWKSPGRPFKNLKNKKSKTKQIMRKINRPRCTYGQIRRRTRCHTHRTQSATLHGECATLVSREMKNIEFTVWECGCQWSALTDAAGSNYRACLLPYSCSTFDAARSASRTHRGPADILGV